MSTIFIAGATGNVGGATLDALLAADSGHTIIAGVHSPDKVAEIEAKGVEARLYDLADYDSVFDALDGVERLLLALPLNPKMRQWGAHLLHAAKEQKVDYIVRSSSMGADLSSHYELGKIHGAIDQDVLDADLRSTILRPCLFMQNYATWNAPMIKETGTISLPESQSESSFIDARDVGAALAGALLDPDEHNGNVYIVTGPEALTNHQVAEAISKVTGKEIVYDAVDFETAGRAMEASGVDEWRVRMIISFHRYAKNHHTSFVTKAVEFLSGKPAKSFAEFAQEHADAWK